MVGGGFWLAGGGVVEGCEAHDVVDGEAHGDASGTGGGDHDAGDHDAGDDDAGEGDVGDDEGEGDVSSNSVGADELNVVSLVPSADPLSPGSDPKVTVLSLMAEVGCSCARS